MYQYKFIKEGNPIDTIVSDTVQDGYVCFDNGVPIDWTKKYYNGTVLKDKVYNYKTETDGSAYLVSYGEPLSGCVTSTTFIDSDSMIYVNDKWVNMPTYYCYYNYGINKKTVSKIYVAKDGEVVTTEENPDLSSMFKSTQGTITHTITTAPVTGDTVTIQGVTLTSPTDASSIATSLNANTKFATYYTATASGNKITVTEKIAGNLKTPTAATYTGTVVISSGKPTASVYGYKNAVIAQQLVALNSTYVNKMYPIERGLVTAYANKNTDTVTALESTLATIQSEYKTKAQAIIDG